jgi:hypothetical protein
MRGSRAIAVCSLAIVVALQVVGVVSHTSLRHIVQTLPLWFPIVLGFRRQDIAKWVALPCLVFWLGIVTLIWLFLLGWARIVSGTFTPVEVAMTFVIGLACVFGLGTAVRWRTATHPLVATTLTMLFAFLQVLAFRVSMLPSIASR